MSEIKDGEFVSRHQAVVHRGKHADGHQESLTKEQRRKRSRLAAAERRQRIDEHLARKAIENA